MRSFIVIVVTFFFCIMTLLSIMTIDSYVLQKDEIERAMDFALEQTMQDPITDPDEIAIKTIENFQSKINSKKGTLSVYVLYADDNIIDLAIQFSYTQINGTKKEIEVRETIIKDWETGKEDEFIVRMIGKEYLSKAPENGGLKENSIWKSIPLLQIVLENEKIEGKWENSQLSFTTKIEK